MNFRSILLWVIKTYPGLTGQALVESYMYKCEQVFPDAWPPPIHIFLDEFIQAGIVEDKFVELDMENCISVHKFYIKDKMLAQALINANSVIYTDLVTGDTRYTNICAN